MRAARCPVILTYHSISERNSPLNISPGLFKEQMEWLGRNARVAPLREVVVALAEHRPLPERTVVLTFDDGFRDFYTSAAPLLRRLALRATVFVPTGYCGKTSKWTGQPQWVAEQALLDWGQIIELARDGFDFGAHSISHPDLTALSREEAENEIAGSKAQIEERTGQKVGMFAYPYGRWSRSVRDIVSRHYEGACSTGAGVVEANADPYVLPRVDAHYVRRPALFQMAFTGSFKAYIAARRLIRRIRRQPEGFYARA